MGQGTDPITIAWELFWCALFLGIMVFIVQQLNSMGIVSVPLMSSINSFFLAMDYIVVIGYILYMCLALALAYYVPTSPVFFFTWILSAIFAFVLTPQLTNAFTQVATTPILSTAYNTLPHTAFVLNNLPLLIFIMSTALAIVSYGKNQQQAATG